MWAIAQATASYYRSLALPTRPFTAAAAAAGGGEVGRTA